MKFRDLPIKIKLRRFVYLITGMILLVTSITFFVYELYKFRESTLDSVSTLAKIIADNGTAALAFYDQKDAEDILESLASESHIVSASFYDKSGRLFAKYNANSTDTYLPLRPGVPGYTFRHSRLEGFEPVVKGQLFLGTLYIRSDLDEMNDRLKIYAFIMAIIVGASIILTYFFSLAVQKKISVPLLTLAETAKAISERKDYSVRAVKTANDEIGLLTEAFNQMLEVIHYQSKELKEFNQQLEEKVSHRTNALESANRELEQFAYIAAHDLQEPLRTITNFVGLLTEKYNIPDEDAKLYVRFVLTATKRMQALIKDVLDFSRTGRNTQYTKVDMEKIVGEVIKDMDQNIREKDAIITYKNLPVIHGYKEELKRLLQNLISNAIKFQKPDSVPVVNISVQKKAKEYVFCVKDNGIGIEQNHLQKLFVIFQRLHSSAEYPGTGIGLATCRKIIALHGGRIWVKSIPGKGSVFYFSIPYKINKI
jgi:signal transduction histidine kinase